MILLPQHFGNIFLGRIKSIREWMKPEPADSLLLKIGKLFFKSLVLLALTALSPVVVVVLIFAFVGAF